MLVFVGVVNLEVDAFVCFVFDVRVEGEDSFTEEFLVVEPVEASGCNLFKEGLDSFCIAVLDALVLDVVDVATVVPLVILVLNDFRDVATLLDFS